MLHGPGQNGGSDRLLLLRIGRFARVRFDRSFGEPQIQADGLGSLVAVLDIDPRFQQLSQRPFPSHLYILEGTPALKERLTRLQSLLI